MWKVVLIVEDDSDGRALMSIIGKTNLRVEVDWLPAGGIGNIKRNAEQLVKLAFARIPNRSGCVAIAVDGDQKSPARDEPHRTLEQVCRKTGARLVIIREAIEAWFLADPGVCSWLGIPLKKSTHRIADPKSRISQAFAKRFNRSYTRRRSREELAQRCTGVDHSKNQSAQTAFSELRKCLQSTKAAARDSRSTGGP
jgi:hypothetical protein